MNAALSLSATSFDSAEHARLVDVDSAKIQPSAIIINPSVLVAKAQPSGFNFRLEITPVDVIAPIVLEYWPYHVVEVKAGPGWPKGGGIGPVIPPVNVSYLLTSASPVGTRGIAVVGKNQTINLDFKRLQ